jgi:hypothetical protein
MKKKTAICIWHTANKGKTETVRKFAKQLITEYQPYTVVYKSTKDESIVPEKDDFILVLSINGKTIGIVSKGDDGYDSEEKFNELAVKYKCDLIICASRTRGETVKAVDRLGKKYGFEEIWTSTYQIHDDEKMCEQLNKLKAKQLLELVKEFKLI